MTSTPKSAELSEAYRYAKYLEGMADEIEWTHYVEDMRYAAQELRRLQDENEALRAQAATAAGQEPVAVLPEIKDMQNAPQQIHGTDRAFWVLGWNECRDTVRDTACANALPKAANGAAPQPAVAAGWVSVDDRLPEPDEPVLAHNGKWTGVAAWMSGEYLEPLERWQDEHREFIEMMGPAITHWMPLPPAPSTEGESNG